MLRDWRFECDKTKYNYDYDSANLVEELKAYTQASLEVGILNIRVINPNLSELVLRRLTKKIDVSCGSDLPGGTMGIAYPFWNRLKIKDVGLKNFISMKSIGKVEGDETLFHEILHLARIDNFPPHLHNSGSVDKSADIVYSCGAMAYSDGKAFDALNSCVVCRLARIDSNGSRLDRDQNSLREAEQFCRSYYKNRPAQFDRLTVSTESLDPEKYLKQTPDEAGISHSYQGEKKTKCEKEQKTNRIELEKLDSQLAAGQITSAEHRMLQQQLTKSIELLQRCD